MWDERLPGSPIGFWESVTVIGVEGVTTVRTGMFGTVGARLTPLRL
jgi:hypothetical protein